MKDYSNIFILDSFLCEGYIANLCNKFNSVFVVQDDFKYDIFNNISTSREVFATILNSIKLDKEQKIMPDLITYFNNLRKCNYISKNIKFNQFVFFILVMEELGILEFKNGVINITGEKNNLNNSSIYNFVSQILPKNKG